MIVIDASAILAIMFRELSATTLSLRLASDQERMISVASYLEAGTVLAGRLAAGERLKAVAYLDAFLAEAGIDLAPVDERQIRVALTARILYGRGMGHGGELNFGDCFSYALAKTLNAPLLFVGSDFKKTDISSALGQS